MKQKPYVLGAAVLFLCLSKLFAQGLETPDLSDVQIPKIFTLYNEDEILIIEKGDSDSWIASINGELATQLVQVHLDEQYLYLSTEDESLVFALPLTDGEAFGRQGDTEEWFSLGDAVCEY